MGKYIVEFSKTIYGSIEIESESAAMAGDVASDRVSEIDFDDFDPVYQLIEIYKKESSDE